MCAIRPMGLWFFFLVRTAGSHKLAITVSYSFHAPSF